MTPQNKRSTVRAQRVAARVSYETFGAKIVRLIIADGGLKKLALIFLTTVALCFIGRVWRPAFPYRLGYVPDRDVVSRASFVAPNAELTAINKREARAAVPNIYCYNPEKFKQYKQQIVNDLQTIVSATDYASMAPPMRNKLHKFLVSPYDEEDEIQAFAALYRILEKDPNLENFSAGLDRALQEYEEYGLLIRLHAASQGNQREIAVYKRGEPPESAELVHVQNVLFGNGYSVSDKLHREFADREFADLIFQRIRSAPLEMETLTRDNVLTDKAQTRAEATVEPQKSNYEIGHTLVAADVPIDANALALLRAEYAARIKRVPVAAIMTSVAAAFCFVAALLFGAYIFMTVVYDSTRRAPKRNSIARLALFYAVLCATVWIGYVLQNALETRVGPIELVPLVTFVELTTLAANWGVALTFGAIIAVLLVYCGGGEINLFVAAMGTAAVVAIATRGARTRLQLFGVALAAVATAFVLYLSIETVGVGVVKDDPFFDASLSALWALLASLLAAAILPLIELAFGVLTPMRLLEIGNPSNKLLLKLNHAAPATYNHSIQTAAIAEAAAEAIGANAPLVRVCAYFHDVGKMLNPSFFTENQRGKNIHDELQPRISVLSIVAHVKDGVEAARQWRLPPEVIALIEQHHGTMRAGFFYERANEAAKQELPPGQNLDDSQFRYPGPIPQSKEAAILMLADAAESASHSLVDPDLAKIEGIVRKIAYLRIEDGQLNDSGLTLGEIRTIEKSLATSILASRHVRVKYPDAKLKELKSAQAAPATQAAPEPAPAAPPAPNDREARANKGAKPGKNAARSKKRRG
ncbi:MAG: HDIG domain-containing protein [Thermoguttaceae bacterium]|nr:HDIG domain-containing protein [Thermoguttaceae bacterium]